MGLGMFFMLNEFRIIAEFGLGGSYGGFAGSTAFLSITNVFEGSYLISLR